MLMAASCGKQSVSTTAEGLVDSMAKGDFTAATAEFDSAMKTSMSPQLLGQTWSQLATQVGAFKARTGTREAEEQGFKTVYVTCQFERATLDAKVVFDGSGQVSGLWLVPTQPSGAK
jgi:hypothetical protein